MSEQNRPEGGSKRGLIALCAVFVVVIAGAAVVYPKLSARMEQQPAVTSDAAPAVREPSVTVAPAQEQQETQAPSTGAVSGPVQKNMAKDFVCYDGEGNAVRLSDLRGKPVVVNFFASWCGPCKIEMPYFEESYKAYGDKVHFMMVNLNAFGNDTEEAARQMIADGGYTFPVYFDTDGEAATGYAIRSMPTTIFVSADGELMGRQTGTIRKEALDATVAQMAAEAE